MDLTEWLQLGGWVLYLLPSIGYVIIDAMTAALFPVPENVDNGIYVLLAGLFVIDATMYYVSWHVSAFRRRGKTPFVLDTAGWGELLFIVSAALYLLQAGLVYTYPYRSPESTFALTTAQVVGYAGVQAGANAVASFSYVVDALIYNAAYFSKGAAKRWKHPTFRRPPWYRNWALWAEILNTVPSLGYMASTWYYLFSFLYLADISTSTSALLAGLQQRISIVRWQFVAWDILFVLDALALAAVWYERRTKNAAKARERTYALETMKSFDVGTRSR